MSAVETTRRDLVLLKGWAFVPVTWERVTANDTILSPVDGRTRHVVSIEKHYDSAIVRVMDGPESQVGEKLLDDPVHVLESEAGFRRAEHEGADPVRGRQRGGT